MVFVGFRESVTEKEAFDYNVGLTAGLVRTANVMLSLTSSSPNCIVIPTHYIFHPDNETLLVHVETSGNLIDEGTDAVAYSCNILHTISSTDKQFAKSAPRQPTVKIVNDDNADVKLRMKKPNTNEYAYDVKFIPLFSREGESRSYGVRLDTVPQNAVKVIPLVALNTENIFPPYPELKVTPDVLEFIPANWNTTQSFHVASLQDHVDHGLQSFQITHRIITDDSVYKAKMGEKENLVAIDVSDDDVVGINWKSSKNVFVLRENGNSETIKVLSLQSQPLFDVNITVDAPPEFLPFVMIEPAYINIQKHAWNNISQEIQFYVSLGIPKNLGIQVYLRPSSKDPKYNSTNAGVVIVAVVESLIRDLDIPDVAQQGENEDYTYTARLTSPLKANNVVTMYISIESGSCTINSAPKVLFKPNALNVPDGVIVKIKTSGKSCAIGHFLNSTDITSPYHGLSKKTLELTVVQNPVTHIRTFPAKISAWKQAYFSLHSPTKEVDLFEYRLDSEPFKILPCPTRSCLVKIPLVDYGQHRFEARAVNSNAQRKDPNIVFYEWEVSDCNDANRVPQQYARVGSDGALECNDCPHVVGANCKTQDVEWDGVFANPNWWTDGTRRDSYYKCPFKTACLGGNTSALGTNGTLKKWYTIKSRCATGYMGVVCAVCEQDYYLLDDLCVKCLPKNGSAEAMLSAVFIGAFLAFLSLLCLQMRVRSSKDRWATMKTNLRKRRSQAGRELKSSIKTVKTVKSAKVFKIFVGFAQITSVSDSAFKIPWPPAFLTFLRFMSPLNFDFFSMSGLGCVVEYNFFDSYLAMMILPFAVSVFIFLTYRLGIWRHESYYKNSFTRGMRSQYANRVVRFSMWIILFVYPPLSRRALEYFTCSGKINDAYYLLKDYRIECFSGKWNFLAVVGIAAALLYPLGIPAFFFLQLWRNRRHLDSDKFQSRYGFLYEHYRRGAYMWDVFEMIRKLFLTGVIVVIFPGETFQVVAVALSNVCFLTFLLIEKPHLPGPSRNLAFMASFAITITMLIGLIMKTVDEAQDYSGLLSTLLIVVNITVALYALKLVGSQICAYMWAWWELKKQDNETERTKVFPSATSEIDHFENGDSRKILHL